jgi:hypothetical protein
MICRIVSFTGLVANRHRQNRFTKSSLTRRWSTSDKQRTRDPSRTLWVFRYCDLNDRAFQTAGRFSHDWSISSESCQPKVLVDPRRLKVNIIAHRWRLIVREAIQRSYPDANRRADDHINKVVTLGTPHQGIALQPGLD